MGIDFYIYSNEISRNTLFGLCDDGCQQPAYFDFLNKENWIATVNNEKKIQLYFIAIDNNIEIRKNNNDMEERCDGMLFTDKVIIFFELKNKRDSWFEKATSQLLTTIKIYLENHSERILKYETTRAYVCNKQHPKFNCSFKDKIREFRNKTKIALFVDTEINIEK